MPQPTQRRRILDAFYASAQAITIANGYETDAGQQVTLGEEPGLGPDDQVGIALEVGDEEPNWQMPGLKRQPRLQVNVHALAFADLDKPWWAAEAVLGDVQRAIEGNTALRALMEWSMECGAVRTADRPPGSKTVGVVVTYFLTWQQGWGAP